MQLGISDMLDRNARFGYCCKKETPAFENATAIEILDFVVQRS